MSFDLGLSHWPYLAIFIAAVVEGEVIFVTACALAGMGLLNIYWVWLAGAMGGSVGDQFFFYVGRKRIGTWLRSIRGFDSYQDRVVGWIQRRATAMMLVCRFLPGLRIAIPISCAWAGVDPLRFSILNFAGAFAWAGLIVLTVSHLAPEALGLLGIEMTWGMTVIGGIILLMFAIARKPEVSPERGETSVRIIR
jgi:membrane protein DedA with SNARE-associated domain